MKKYVAGAGIAVGLLGGSLALSTVNPLSLAGAQGSTQATSPVDAAKGERTRPLDAALEELVADGTITQEQADAVAQRTKAKQDEARPDRKGDQRKDGQSKDRKGSGFGKGAGFSGIGEAIDDIASQFGITAEQLKDAVKGGTSLDDLAREHGVDPATVSQAIVDAVTTRLDAAVATGTLTQGQADVVKAQLTKNIDAVMRGSIKDFGFGRGHGRAGD